MNLWQEKCGIKCSSIRSKAGLCKPTRSAADVTASSSKNTSRKNVNLLNLGKENTNSFVETIDSWHDFYMLAGGASATLVGLIFVAVTLHIDVIAEAKKSSDVRMLVEQIFINFILILCFSFIFVVPSDSPNGIGYPLLILGMIEIAHTAVLWLRFLRMRGEDRIFTSAMILRRILLPNTICYIALIIIGADVLQGGTRYLGWMVMVIVWLIISATQSTWDLMLRIAEMKNPIENN